MTKKQSSRDGVSAVVKAEVMTRANELIETILKPQLVQPPPENPQFNYIVDVYGKWYQRYFYFCATYRVPNTEASIAHFEAKCARMEYFGNNRFHLAFPRHTGQWVTLYIDSTLDECLKSIRDEPFFFP